MLRKLVFFIGIIYGSVNGQIVLTHNTGDNFFGTSIYGCSDTGLRWSRVFELSDFGIADNESLELTSGITAMRVLDSNGINYMYNIYEIDDNFPESFNENNLLGSSQQFSAFFSSSSHVLQENNFDNPILIPADVQKILVEIKQVSGDVVFLSGTAQDTDLSWFKSDAGGCDPNNYTNTIDLGREDARFYIKVLGEEFLSVGDLGQEINIDLFPNPAIDTFQIRGLLTSEINDIRIYDLKGNLLSITAGKEANSINVAGLSQGVYFAQISDLLGRSVTKRVIKK